MGLYPPGQGTPLTETQLEAASSVPFKVRDAAKLNKKLGLNPLPGKFEQMPLYSYNNGDIHDEVSYDGCPFVNEVELMRVYDP